MCGKELCLLSQRFRQPAHRSLNIAGPDMILHSLFIFSLVKQSPTCAVRPPQPGDLEGLDLFLRNVPARATSKRSSQVVEFYTHREGSTIHPNQSYLPRDVKNLSNQQSEMSPDTLSLV